MRRRIWEYFNEHKFEIPFVFEWYGGLRLNLYLGNDLSRQLFIAGCTEPNELAFLDGLLVPGMVFIDAGANDGLFTMFASQRIGQEGKVWAFEPSEREFARLEQNLTLNQLQNVRPFRVALAERDGEEDLAVAGYEHEGQNTLGVFVYEGVKLARTERVTIRKLDELVREEKLSKVDVMKLDVEGAEHRVLEGSREVLTRFRPVVLFEVFDAALQKQGSSRDKLLELFRSLSYKLLIFDSRSGQPAPAPSGAFSDNMIAIPAESPAVDQFPSSESGDAAQS
jgi:FkbM family methyltransferase